MTSHLKPRKRSPHTCGKCGSEALSLVQHADLVDFKGLTLDVDNLAATVCQSCGHQWVTPGQEVENIATLKGAFAKKRDEIREADGLLSGEKINWVLKQLHLSKAEAATVFGGGPNAFSKYINGEVLQSVAMDKLLRLTLAFGDHALRYLKGGRNAPLVRYAGMLITSPATYSVQTPVIEVKDVRKRIEVAGAGASTTQVRERELESR